LSEYPPLPESAAPLLTAIVPARNEARNIERCVRSILASEYPDLEVVAVDDHSTDGTGEILERLALEDDRLRVLRAQELPEGWFGKPWACWQGYRAARGSLLLFTDADTEHGPLLHGHAVAMLFAERAQLVTVMPRQEMLTFWERVVQPHFFLLLGIRYGSPERLNRNADPRHAIANGQFILVTRESYEALGGHGRVHGQVVEDLALAQEYAGAGRRLFFAVADQHMTTRMYTSLREIVDGWTKNTFVGMRRMARSRFGQYVWLVAALGVPLLWILPLGLLGWGVAERGAALAAFGAVSAAGSLATMAMLLRLMKAPPLYAPLYPLGALVTAFILLRAAARGTRKIEWKGRTYSSGAVVST
jgi:chlorobactene glucosyltransferase